MIGQAQTGRIWRAFYTRSRAERKVEQLLAACDLEVFLPKRVVTRQWSDRKRRVVQALFPGYIFARVDERERLTVLRTNGVVHCIAVDGRPAVVPEQDIRNLKTMQRDPDRIEAIRLPLPKRGSRVVIWKGVMQGLEGEVEEHRRGTYVVVTIASVRQAVRVEVPADWVEPVREAVLV